MGERLAAVRLRRTGCRSSRENLHARYSSKDHRLDCVPVSAMAIVVTWVLWAFSVIVAGLSTEMVMGTVGWSLSWACHHSPLVAWFCSSCSLHFHYFCGNGFPALLACGCSWMVYRCHLRNRLWLDGLNSGKLWAYLASSHPVAIYAYLVQFRIPPTCSLCEDLEGAHTFRAWGFSILIHLGWDKGRTGLGLLVALEGWQCWKVWRE